MPEKNKKGIDNIQRGRIDYYFPITFDTSLEWTKILEKIANELSIESRERYENDVQTSMPYIEVLPGEVDALFVRNNEFETEYEQYSKLYGSDYLCFQDRLILPPVKIELYNGEQVWLNVVLIVFANNMGIIKLELPLVNVSVKYLLEYKHDSYIKQIIDANGFSFPDKPITFEKIFRTYRDKIKELGDCEIILQEGIIINILLSKYDNMPKQMENMSNEVQEDLYKIIAAPIPEINGVSYRQKAHQHLENHSFGYWGMKYFTSSVHICLSVIDQRLYDFVCETYKLCYEMKELNDADLVKIQNNLIRDLCINVEFALIILILKKINTSYIFKRKLDEKTNLYKANQLFNFNEMFICQLQEHCYGSVSDQVAVFKKIMPFYLKEDLTIEKTNAINNIINNENDKREKSIQSFISTLGIIIALVFGLPAIYETIVLVRGICTFITIDIPLFTLTNASVCLWIVMIIILVIKAFKSTIKKSFSRLFKTVLK